MQASTSLGAHPGRLHQPHRVEQVGEEQPVDDEAGLVGDLDRGLAQRRAPGARALGDPVAQRLREAELDQLHPRDRVEDVKAEEALRRRRRARASSAIESEEVVVARSASGAALAERREQLGLRVGVLDDRLDDEVAAGEVGRARWSP